MFHANCIKSDGGVDYANKLAGLFKPYPVKFSEFEKAVILSYFSPIKSFCSVSPQNHGVTISKAQGLVFLRFRPNTIELQQLKHLWNHGNMFKTGVVLANEG